MLQGAAIGTHSRQYELRRSRSPIRHLFVGQETPSGRQARDRQTVPVGQNLVVGRRPPALATSFQQRRSQGLDLSQQILARQPPPQSLIVNSRGQMQHVTIRFEEGWPFEPEQRCQEPEVLATQSLQKLLALPDVVGTFAALRFRIDGAPERALW